MSKLWRTSWRYPPVSGTRFTFLILSFKFNSFVSQLTGLTDFHLPSLCLYPFLSFPFCHAFLLHHGLFCLYLPSELKQKNYRPRWIFWPVLPLDRPLSLNLIPDNCNTVPLIICKIVSARGLEVGGGKKKEDRHQNTSPLVRPHFGQAELPPGKKPLGERTPLVWSIVENTTGNYKIHLGGGQKQSMGPQMIGTRSTKKWRAGLPEGSVVSTSTVTVPTNCDCRSTIPNERVTRQRDETGEKEKEAGDSPGSRSK